MIAVDMSVDSNPKRSQVNVGFDPEFYDRMVRLAEDIGIKVKPTQIVREVVEEFFDLWLMAERAKREKLKEVKESLKPPPIKETERRKKA